MRFEKSNIIILEGGDGAGKASIAANLKNILQNERHWTVMHREYPRYDMPTGKVVKMLLNGEFGDPVAMDAKVVCMPYLADRLDDYENTWPIYNVPRVILCDRGWTSNLLYQGVKVYFKPVFECLNAGWMPRPFLGAFNSETELYEYKEKLYDELQKVADTNPKLIQQYGNGCVAIIKKHPEAKVSSSATFEEIQKMKYVRFGPEVWYGLLATDLSKWKCYTDNRRFTYQFANRFLDFSRWLYKHEVTDTCVGEFPQHVYFITRDASALDRTNKLKYQMINAERKLDMFEQAFTYQHLVQILMDMILDDEIGRASCRERV